jgi:hypothetical protein
MGAGEVVATGAGAGAPGAAASAAGVVAAPGAGGGVGACGSEAAGVGAAAGDVDVALGGGLAGGGAVGGGVVAVGLAEGVVGDGVFSCAAATAKPPSVNANAIPASLEAFKYCERREAMAPKSVPMLESSKPHR